MTNKIIIDGWNVCWKIPEIAELIPDHLERARNRLNTLIKIFFQGKKVEYKIFYDGQPLFFSGAIQQDHSVYFSTSPEKADELIIKFLQKQSKKENWTVITSDRELTYRVKNNNALILTSEAFVSKLISNRSPKFKVNTKENPRIDQEDISYWLNKFKNNTNR
jgi:predicted RNA-binding protein with PIN domain